VYGHTRLFGESACCCVRQVGSSTVSYNRPPFDIADEVGETVATDTSTTHSMNLPFQCCQSVNQSWIFRVAQVLRNY